MKFKISLIIIFLSICQIKAIGQIVINEVCPYNASGLTDENNKAEDWIEIYNTSSNAVNLEAYAIENSKAEKWFFPNIWLGGNKFLIIFASGNSKTDSILHCTFKISKEGDIIRLFNKTNQEIDELSFGKIHINHSAGRQTDGNENIKIFNQASPGISNNASEAFDAYAINPIFSIPAGFYDSEQMLTIKNLNADTKIFYTTNGSQPDTNATLYTHALTIDSTTVIKAIAFSSNPNILPSEIICNTYFINYKSVLPVFSISTNPDNLWDWNHGIYVMGPNADSIYPYHGANFWQDWEIPAHIEFFDENKHLAMMQDAGISINGGSVSRTRPMQSLRITARKMYGDQDLSYKFFDQKNISHFKTIVLRNSSLDFNKTHFRDGCLHQLMIGNLNIDLLSYQPSVVFINGKYWGIQNIRERFSKHYIEENYRYDEDSVDLLEEDTAIIEGSFADFNKMLQYITTKPMNVKEYFDTAKTMIDIESLSDYFIAETYLSNTDWPYNNLKYWKSHYPQTKWRYMLMDMDVSLGNNGWAPASMDLLGIILSSYGDTNKHVQILKSLLKNNDFKTYFINRYADLVNTIFSTEYMKKHIETVKSKIEPEMPHHFARWGSNTNAWNYEINQVVMPYIESRPAYALKFVEDTFKMKKQLEISLNVFPQNGGLIKLNTIKPSILPWQGKYFDGNPITLSAIPNPGYHFKQWQSTNTAINHSAQTSITLNADTNTLFTAIFEQYLNNNEIIVYPNPVETILNFEFILENASNGIIRIYTPTLNLIKEQTIEAKQGLNTAKIPVSDLKAGIYIIKTEFANEQKIGKFLIAL